MPGTLPDPPSMMRSWKPVSRSLDLQAVMNWPPPAPPMGVRKLSANALPANSVARISVDEADTIVLDLGIVDSRKDGLSSRNPTCSGSLDINSLRLPHESSRIHPPAGQHRTVPRRGRHVVGNRGFALGRARA